MTILQNLSINNNTYYFDEIDSTQLEIFRMIEAGVVKSGYIVIAKKQTFGIGTHGRKWINTNEGIYFSIYFEPNYKVKEMGDFSIKIAYFIKKYIEDKYNKTIDIKYPNDLYINGKKFGGILVQSRVFENKIKYFVIGIGINNGALDFDSEISDIATSFYKEFEIKLDANQLISELRNSLLNNNLEQK